MIARRPRDQATGSARRASARGGRPGGLSARACPAATSASALAFAQLELLGPIAGLGVTTNVLFTPLVLGEPVSPLEILGALYVTAGVGIIGAVASKAEVELQDPADIIGRFGRTPMIIYIAVTATVFISTLLCICMCGRRKTPLLHQSPGTRRASWLQQERAVRPSAPAALGGYIADVYVSSTTGPAAAAAKPKISLGGSIRWGLAVSLLQGNQCVPRTQPVAVDQRALLLLPRACAVCAVSLWRSGAESASLVLGPNPVPGPRPRASASFVPQVHDAGGHPDPGAALQTLRLAEHPGAHPGARDQIWGRGRHAERFFRGLRFGVRPLGTVRARS